MMIQLKSLIIHFLPLASWKSGNARQPLAVRATLPALTKFHFSGDRAYLDDLISRLDSPTLEQSLNPRAFETRRFARFTSHGQSSSSLITHQSFLLLEDKIFFCCTSTIQLIHDNAIVSEEINSKTTLPYIFTRHSSNLHAVKHIEMKSFLLRSPDPDDVNSAMWVVFFRKLVNVGCLRWLACLCKLLG